MDNGQTAKAREEPKLLLLFRPTSLFYGHPSAPSFNVRHKVPPTMPDMIVFRNFWSAYNAEDTPLPLYLPLIIWIAAFLYCKLTRRDFHRWYTLHNFHNFGVIVLGQISIHAADDTIFRERIATLWSAGYFGVDLVDCTARWDVPYATHAVCCLALCAANYYTPLCQELRMTSKAALLELSNPFMHLAKKTRKPWHFALFAVVYTCCRVVWIPVLMQQVLQGGMRWSDPIFLVLTAFYGLNLFWYYKIVRILVRGNEDESKPKKE